MPKCVVLGITGSIAAYKAAEIVSRLKKKDVDVRVILTKAGAEFITPLTLETLSHAPVTVDMFHRETPWEVEHIALAKRADVFLVAPASADILAKAAKESLGANDREEAAQCHLPVRNCGGKCHGQEQTGHHCGAVNDRIPGPGEDMIKPLGHHRGSNADKRNDSGSGTKPDDTDSQRRKQRNDHIQHDARHGTVIPNMRRKLQ